MTVTVIIPISEPFAAAERLMSYFRRVRFPMDVVFGCPSEEARARLQAFAGTHLNPKITCVVAPGDNLGRAALACLPQVATGHAVMIDARDFPLAKGLAQLSRFLTRHRSYKCAGGQAICHINLPAATDEGADPMPFGGGGLWHRADCYWRPTDEDYPVSQRRASRRDLKFSTLSIIEDERWWAPVVSRRFNRRWGRHRFLEYTDGYRSPYGLVYKTAFLAETANRIARHPVRSGVLADIQIGWETVLKSKVYWEASWPTVVMPVTRLGHLWDHRVLMNHLFTPALALEIHGFIARTGASRPLWPPQEFLRALMRKDLWPAVQSLIFKQSLPTHREPQRHVDTIAERNGEYFLGRIVQSMGRGTLPYELPLRPTPMSFLIEQFEQMGLKGDELLTLMRDLTEIRSLIVDRTGEVAA